MRSNRYRYTTAALAALLVLALSLMTGCAQPTATPLPPVTVVQPAAPAEAPAATAKVAAPPTTEAQAPTAYVGPPTADPAAQPAATFNPYPEPTIPAKAASRASFSVTIMHVNDVYGEIDPCG